MRTRIITFLLAALAALAMMAAPAAAHPHAKAANGFVGPDPTGPGAIAHTGIQCAALSNPNLGLLPLECPSPVR